MDVYAVLSYVQSYQATIILMILEENVFVSFSLFRTRIIKFQFNSFTDNLWIVSTNEWINLTIGPLESCIAEQLLYCIIKSVGKNKGGAVYCKLMEIQISIEHLLLAAKELNFCYARNYYCCLLCDLVTIDGDDGDLVIIAITSSVAVSIAIAAVLKIK